MITRVRTETISWLFLLLGSWKAAALSGFPSCSRHDILKSSLTTLLGFFDVVQGVAPETNNILTPATVATTTDSGIVASRPPDEITLPIRFLPKSGCWALRTSVLAVTGFDIEEGTDAISDFNYFAVVDSASPFLTAPLVAVNFTRPIATLPATSEQYGDTIGVVEWRRADLMTWIGADGDILETANSVLGMPDKGVVENTGGVFVGLIGRDDNRPTFLEQAGGYTYWKLVAGRKPQLCLSRRQTISANDPDSFALFDLSPFGPDLYHYAIQCDELKLRTSFGVNTESIVKVSDAELRRPLVLVIDTGLTGCIMSSSLQEELGFPIGTDTLEELSISLSTVGKRLTRLSASREQDYWRISSIHLPWFPKESKHSHPHILAIGSTIWASSVVRSVAIDTRSRRAKIEMTSTAA